MKPRSTWQRWLPLGLGISSIGGFTTCAGIQRVEEVRFGTTDLDNFWAAYPAVRHDTAQAVSLLQQQYFAPGSPGLREYYQNRYQSNPRPFAHRITQHPRFYASARPNMQAVAAQKPHILAAFRRLQALYPPVRFNHVYFVVGGFRGSTAQRQGLLIGVEYLVDGPGVDTSELSLVERRRCAPLTAIPAMVTHEMIHNTQQPADGTLLGYAIREGMVPHDLPPWNVVWASFRRWCDNGALEQVHEALRPLVRQQAGKAPQPTAAIVDSQAVRTAGKKGAAGATTPAKA